VLPEDLWDPSPLITSPVGLDNAFMFKKPLYSYYHRVSGGSLNTVPALRFSQYQDIPLVAAALDSLQHTKDSLFWANNALILVNADRVWIPDLWTDPNSSRWSVPTFRDLEGATIGHVRTCDFDSGPYTPRRRPIYVGPHLDCPGIAGQGQ
jgi:hypothetical protein